MARLMGIDPGLRFTGWGVIDVHGNRLRHVADGVIATDNTHSVPHRLKFLHDALTLLFQEHRPDEAAVEETYVNRNGTSKEQVALMVRRLLPGATIRRADAADALAVAICHAHHRSTRLRVNSGTVMA